MHKDESAPWWFQAICIIIAAVIVYGCATAPTTPSETWEDDWNKLVMPPGAKHQCYEADYGEGLYCIEQ